jgi:orotate phosphoribosyltransferase-like protein
MQRPLSEIESEITLLSARLNELALERQDALDAKHSGVVRLFDAGLSRGEIARDLRMPKGTVAWILHKHGRTDKGRTAIAQQIDAHVRAGAPA